MQFNTVQVTVDRFFEQYLPGTTSPREDSSGEDAPREDIPPKDIPDKYLGKLHYVSDFKKLTPEWKVNTEICRIAKEVASCDIDDDREPPIAVRDVSNWSVGDKASSTTEVKAAATPPSSGQATDDKTAEDADTATRTDVGVFFNDRRYDGFVFKDPDEFMKKSKMHKNNKAQRKDWVGNCSWADVIIPIEVKIDLSRSAFYFDDDPDKFMRTDTNEGREALGQIAEYMAQIFGHQHRKHLHAVYVYKNRARLLYFDRQGGVVSEPFDYGTREHLTLHTFFWRIAHMSREELGFDPTVVLASEDEKNKMRDFAASAPTEYLKRQIYHALSLDQDDPSKSISSQWPAYKLTMCGRDYIIGRPTFASPALYGRCTRGYLAFDLDVDGNGNGAVRFLKDSWRPDLERVQPEHKVYERLKANGVTEHVLTCLGHEDVPDSDGSWQLTRTHELISSTRPARGHYRILIEQVCRPLIDFTDFGELTERICEAIYAHRCAWERAGILHRDVSVNNIMIFEFVGADGKVERKGMLCDWDLCKYVEQMKSSQKSRTIDRTGTWSFRSALSVLFPGKPYYLSDDIESFIHVYHYCVLRFHLTSCTEDLSRHVAAIYEFATVRQSDGAHIGHHKKLEQMENSKPPMKVYGNPTLDAFLTELAQLYSRHYSMIDIDGYRKAYNPIQVKPVNLVKRGTTHTAKFLKLKRQRSGESLRPAQSEKPKVTQVAPRRTMDANGPLSDHEQLLQLFVRYTSDSLDEEKEGVPWPDVTTKCEDLFTGTSLPPHKDNAFSSIPTSQDVEEGRPGKKRKGNDGSALPDVEETVEEGTGV